MEHACNARPLSLTVTNAHQKKRVLPVFQTSTSSKTVSVCFVLQSMRAVESVKAEANAPNVLQMNTSFKISHASCAALLIRSAKLVQHAANVLLALITQHIPMKVNVLAAKTSMCIVNTAPRKIDVLSV